MARLDGKKAAQEMVLEVAKLAAAAAYRAPQLTAKMDLKTEIVTGDDIKPIVEFFEAVIPISPVMYFDFQSLKYFIDKGNPPPILLLGTDLTRSELGWDCGACGFDTCAEFNAYTKKNRTKGAMFYGPSCQWKLLDYGAACDFSLAAIAQQKYDCRIMGTLGAAAAGVGYLPDCSCVLGVPIGPPGDFIYFSRSQNLKTASDGTHREWLRRTSPTNWQAFPGSTKPCAKTKQDWWNNPEYVKFEPLSEPEQKFAGETLEKAMQVSQKHFPNVAAWYKKEDK